MATTIFSAAQAHSAADILSTLQSTQSITYLSQSHSQSQSQSKSHKKIVWTEPKNRFLIEVMDKVRGMIRQGEIMPNRFNETSPSPLTLPMTLDFAAPHPWLFTLRSTLQQVPIAGDQIVSQEVSQDERQCNQTAVASSCHLRTSKSCRDRSSYWSRPVDTFTC